ncbi:MAG: alcohol dehydrogenase catalytic domain-containing protein [Thermoplasmata archaeon]|jgi:threonine dehydrogenase-like Zn-dependent dehydrogenase
MWKIIFEPGERIFKKIIIPQEPLKEGLIRFKPKYYSVCGSDKSIVSGHRNIEHPVVIGHELSGNVINGKGYDMDGEKLKEGDSITILPNYYCGECINCLHENFNTCNNKIIIGVKEDGGLAEYLDLKPKFALKLPKTLPLELGALIEPIAVGVHALKKFSTKENPLVIIGGGGTGALSYETALNLGFKDVSIIEVNEKKIEMLRSIGIDVYKSIEEFNGSKTYPLNILDTVGEDSLIEKYVKIFDSVASGSEIIITGLGSREFKFTSDLLIRKEVKIQGSIIYTPKDFIITRKLMLENQEKYLKFITNIIDLNSIKDINDLKNIILNNDNIKTLIKLY